MTVHHHGRSFVRGMEVAGQGLVVGENAITELAEMQKGYCALLCEHIEKADNLLYQLAECILPEDLRSAMISAYTADEATKVEVEVTFRRVVGEHEAKLGL